MGPKTEDKLKNQDDLKNEDALLNEDGIGEIYATPRLSLEFKVEILGMGGGVIQQKIHAPLTVPRF